jgi:hypothetical protein
MGTGALLQIATEAAETSGIEAGKHERTTVRLRHQKPAKLRHPTDLYRRQLSSVMPCFQVSF